MCVIRCWILYCDSFLSDGLDSSTENDSNPIGTNVKQEPVSDDDCPSEEGYGFDGDNDPFDEDDTFVHSKFQFQFLITDPLIMKSFFVSICLLFLLSLQFSFIQVILMAVIMIMMMITTNMEIPKQKNSELSTGNVKISPN